MVMAAMTGDPVFTESQAYDTLGLGPCEEQARIDREERQAYAAANYLGDVPADDPISSPVGGTVATVLVVLDPGQAMHAVPSRSLGHSLAEATLTWRWMARWLAGCAGARECRGFLWLLPAAVPCRG
jgi:hypothetical protein